MYDVRRPCDRSPDKDGPLCYKQLEWIPVWLNDKDVKTALGANPARTFNGSSEEVFQDFFTSGDLMHYSAGLLTDLVNDGIRLLVYAGETGETLGSSSTCMCSNFGRWCLQFLRSVAMDRKAPQRFPQGVYPDSHPFLEGRVDRGSRRNSEDRRWGWDNRRKHHLCYYS